MSAYSRRPTMMEGRLVGFLTADEEETPIRAGDRRHPETAPYRCFLSDLTGFGALRRAGPARTAKAG